MISSELEVKCDQTGKLQRTEEELLVARTELDCLRRELADKTSLINGERAKLEELIRSQEVAKNLKIYEFFSGNLNFDF